MSDGVLSELEEEVRVSRNGPRVRRDQHLETVDIAPQGLQRGEDLVAVALGLFHGGADSLRLFDRGLQPAEVFVCRIENSAELLQYIFGNRGGSLDGLQIVDGIGKKVAYSRAAGMNCLLTMSMATRASILICFA